jgi:hypothetical protein
MKLLPVLTMTMAAACGGPSTPSTPGQTGTVELAWNVQQAADENVNVTLVVAGQEIVIGPLNAGTDDLAPGTPATCSVARSSATVSEFTCGGTPAYNHYVARLEGRELVVTFVAGVDKEIAPDATEERREVKRIPVTGTALVTAPYVPRSSGAASGLGHDLDK